MMRIDGGRLFQTSGPQTANACHPNIYILSVGTVIL